MGYIEQVHAMTDVTGFGLLGHLVEMAEGSHLSAVIDMQHIPLIIEELKFYVDHKSVPGGTTRNWDSYGHKIGPVEAYQKAILADPQTSGGLLVAVAPEAVAEVQEILKQNGLDKFTSPIGRLTKKADKIVIINP